MDSRGLLFGCAIALVVVAACWLLEPRPAAVPGHVRAEPLGDAVSMSRNRRPGQPVATASPGPAELNALVQAQLDRLGRFPVGTGDLAGAKAAVVAALQRVVARRYDAHNPIQTNYALSRLFPAAFRVRAGAWILVGRVSVGRHDDRDELPQVTVEFFDTLRQDAATGRPPPQAVVFSTQD